MLHQSSMPPAKTSSTIEQSSQSKRLPHLHNGSIGGAMYGAEDMRAETAHTAGNVKDATSTQFKEVI